MERAAMVLMRLHSITNSLEREHHRLLDQSYAIGKQAFSLNSPSDLEGMTPSEAMDLTKKLGIMEANQKELEFINQITTDVRILVETIAGQEEGA